MNANRGVSGARGFVLPAALMSAFVVIAGVLIIARLALLEIGRDRQSDLSACADQLVESAREWTRLQPGALADGSRHALPTDGLLPVGYTGTLTLERSSAAGDVTMVHCEVTLTQGRRQLRRAAEWPLPVPVGAIRRTS